MVKGNIENKRVTQILELLDNEYGTKPICYLNYKEPYELLFATIMSAQCTDARVNIVTDTLFKKYKSLEAFSIADLKELEEDIKPTGFYHNKATNIKKCATMLLDLYDGIIPSDIDKLTALAGVGRKTANVIRTHIFNIPSIVVDTHVKRVSNLLGLTENIDPVKIEYDLMDVLDNEHWARYNSQIMALGRTYCNARKKSCSECFMKEVCKYNLENNK